MKTYEYQGAPHSVARSHPWTDAAANSAFRYYDLSREPERIRGSLEDFVPWGGYPAVERFYSLLEWLHAPDSAGQASLFETNDCAFSGPHANEAAEFPKSLQCTGRVMLLYRDLPINRSRRRMEALEFALHQRLQSMDQEFEWGVVATTIVPVRYLALPVRQDGQSGHQLMISFWAWGDEVGEVMGNLNRVFENLFGALRDLADSPR